jgi:hypothetical protein
MKKYCKLFGLSFLSWLLAFLLSVLLSPLKKSANPLFETLMPLILVTICIFAVFLWFRKVSSHYIREGILLGSFLFGVNIVFDLLMFLWGPMQMTFTAYMNDIGFTYLIYPIITVGFGALLNQFRKG